MGETWFPLRERAGGERRSLPDAHLDVAEACGRGAVGDVRVLARLPLAAVREAEHRGSAAGAGGRSAPATVRCNHRFGVDLQQIAELLGSETRISGDTAHGECIDRVMARNCEYSSAIEHYDVLTLANDTKAGLPQCPNSVKVVDTRDLWQRYTVTSISRMSSPRSCSSTTDKYSRIASRMFSIASSSVAP